MAVKGLMKSSICCWFCLFYVAYLSLLVKWQRSVLRLFQFVSKSLILMTDILSPLWLIKLDTKVRFWAHSFTHTVLQFEMFCKKHTILIYLSFKRGSFSLSGQLSCCSVSCYFCIALYSILEIQSVSVEFLGASYCGGVKSCWSWNVFMYFRNTECVYAILSCLLLWWC